MDTNNFLYEGEANVKLLVFSKCEKCWKKVVKENMGSILLWNEAGMEVGGES